MLKTKSFCTPSTPRTDAKEHLLNVHYRRQNQLASTINECHRLRTLHKRLFDQQLNSYLPHQSFTSKSTKNDSPSILNDQTELENDVPIAKESSDYLSESSNKFSDYQLRNNRLISPMRKNQQQFLSVSSIASIDKRTNKTHEKSPHYPQIVSYRTGKTSSNSMSSRQSDETSQHKRKEPVIFVDIAKQIKTLSSIQRNSVKTIPLGKSPVIEKVPVNTSMEDIQPKLLPIICPSSIIYSKRIQTHRRLIKNYFSLRTLPLI